MKIELYHNQLYCIGFYFRIHKFCCCYNLIIWLFTVTSGQIYFKCISIVFNSQWDKYINQPIIFYGSSTRLVGFGSTYFFVN